jgi:hypothetical protein
MQTRIECAMTSDNGDDKPFYCKAVVTPPCPNCNRDFPPCGGDTLQVFVIDHASNGDFGNWCNVGMIYRKPRGSDLWIEDYTDEVEDPDNFKPEGQDQPAPDPNDGGNYWYEETGLRCAKCHKEYELEELAEAKEYQYC